MGTQRTFFLLVIFVLPLFISTYSASFSENLRNSFFSVTKPLLSLSKTATQTFTDTLTNARRFFFLYQENQKLKKEIDILEKEIVSLHEAEKENGRFRSLLDFRKKTPTVTIACQIIARDVTHLSNWALINKGSRSGIKKEMPVMNEQGLVGKVVEVSSQTARIILLTDLESRVSGLVQSTRDTGLVTGDGSPFLKMKFIDLDSSVKVGDTVISSGLGDVYPKGIAIGKIEFLGREKNGLHLYARIKPVVSFSKMEEILCLDYRLQN